MTEEKIKSKYKLKKLIKMLGDIKGRHTELVSVYVPAGANIHDVISQLRSEHSTAENIKSKQVKKNVTSALDKIVRELQFYKKTPPNGLAVFCGNISEKEGVSKIELWSIEPPDALKTRLYWCDQVFVLDPLREMVEEKEIYGIICLDKSEADIALLKGKKIEPIFHKESIVPGKSRAGGQSSARFSRIREGLLNDWFKEVGESANKIFDEHKEVKGILLSGPGPIKEMFLKEEYVYARIKEKILGTVDTSYTGDHGLHETLERGQHLIKEAAVIKEKKMLQRFFTELRKPGGLAVYGISSVLEYLRKGMINIIIIDEDSTLKEMEYECKCGLTKRVVDEKEKNSLKCDKCSSPLKILGEMDIIDMLEEEAKNYGTSLFIVSSDTREGNQFKQLGGIGAILRYRS